MVRTARLFRDREWVSKTDMVQYLRCPYVFWLIDTGQIKAADAWSSVQARVIAEGQRFHEAVEAALPPADRYVRTLADVVARDARVLGLREVYRNESLKILGTPDGVAVAGGALCPIEIKSHRRVNTTDRLELAFYHLVLDPYRTRPAEAPRGYVLLRPSAGDDEDLGDEVLLRPEAYEELLTEVLLEPEHFDRVRELIEAVRLARRVGVEPRLHSCAVCQGLMRDRVLRSTKRRKDVSLIYGIGWEYAKALERLGVRSYEDLIVADPETLASDLRRKVSPKVVHTWITHAKSYMNAGPVVFGRDPLPPLDPLVSLDFEYDETDGQVWLIGACRVTDGRRQYAFLWEDSSPDERAGLLRLLGLDPGALDPLPEFQPALTNRGAIPVRALGNRRDRQRVLVGGLLRNVDVHPTRTGKKMAVVTLDDLTGSTKVQIFPKEYSEHENVLRVGTVAFLRGRVSKVRGAGGVSVICDEIGDVLRAPADSLATPEDSAVVATWAGAGAEFTKTRCLIPGLDLRTIMGTLRPRHFDAYQFLCRNIRLPTPEYSLKGVGRYLKLRRRSAIRDGLEANAVHQRFLRAKGTKRERLRAELEEYNRDDIDGTIRALYEFRDILATCEPVPMPIWKDGPRPAESRPFTSNRAMPTTSTMASSSLIEAPGDTGLERSLGHPNAPGS